MRNLLGGETSRANHRRYRRTNIIILVAPDDVGFVPAGNDHSGRRLIIENASPCVKSGFGSR